MMMFTEEFSRKPKAWLRYYLSNDTMIFQDEESPDLIYQVTMAGSWAFTYGIWELTENLKQFQPTDKSEAELLELMRLDKQVEPLSLAVVSFDPEYTDSVIFVCKDQPAAVFSCPLERLGDLTLKNTKNLKLMYDDVRGIDNPQQLLFTDDEIIAY